MEKVQQVLALVEELTAKEQQQVLDHLALRKQSGKKTTVKGSRDNDLWVGEVVDALDAILRSGGSSSPTLAVVKRLQGDSWSSLQAFMEQSKLQEQLSATERVGAYRIMAKLLVNHAAYVARKSGAPLSPKLVFNCIGNLPGLFDSAYPGYLAAGLAKVVILRKL